MKLKKMVLTGVASVATLGAVSITIMEVSKKKKLLKASKCIEEKIVTEDDDESSDEFENEKKEQVVVEEQQGVDKKKVAAAVGLATVGIVAMAASIKSDNDEENEEDNEEDMETPVVIMTEDAETADKVEEWLMTETEEEGE